MKDNEETKNTLRNEERAATSGTQVRGPRFRNADNQDLWWWEKLPDGGDAPEVNGYWAGEIQEFVPTSGELLVLAEHTASLPPRPLRLLPGGANQLPGGSYTR
jgi:hypothetical protein